MEAWSQIGLESSLVTKAPSSVVLGPGLNTRVVCAAGWSGKPLPDHRKDRSEATVGQGEQINGVCI